MGSKKLVYCCIIGILLGFILPFFLKTDGYSTLMIGMVAGLAVGYLLDARDKQKSGEEGQRLINDKAEKANQLMERARRGVENEYLRMDYEEEEEEETPAEEEAEESAPIETEETDPVAPVIDYEAEAEEQEQKLNEAEELLRAARERMK